MFDGELLDDDKLDASFFSSAFMLDQTAFISTKFLGKLCYKLVRIM